MNKLSSNLKAKIAQNPTNTYIKSTNEITAEKYELAPQSLHKDNIPLPINFNGKEIWKKYLTPVKNQGLCGSCYAFATTSCLADRFNIQSQGKLNINLSPASLLICDFLGQELETESIGIEHNLQMVNLINTRSLENAGCTGNSLIDAWRYLFLIGTTTSECVPDDLRPKDKPLSKFSSNDKLPLCSDLMGVYGDMCVDKYWDPKTALLLGTPARFWRAFRYYYIPNDVKQIMTDIYLWGPVTTGFKVYADFYQFDPKKEIYKYDGTSPFTGGHAVEIVSWGEENGVPYWEIKNSWGKEWGREGYFRMIRGINNCELEENVFGALPDFFYPIGYEIPDISDKIHVPSRIKLERTKFDTGEETSTGGIDPSTGFARRIMIRLANFDYSSPIKEQDWPNYNTLIAGEIPISIIHSSHSKENILLVLILIYYFLLVIKIKVHG